MLDERLSQHNGPHPSSRRVRTKAMKYRKDATMKPPEHGTSLPPHSLLWLTLNPQPIQRSASRLLSERMGPLLCAQGLGASC